MKNISNSSQDYLETILDLSKKNASTRSTDIATAMQVSRASVNRAINLLKEKGLICQEKYSTINLTQEGEKVATAVKKTHMIVKEFLTKILGVSAENADLDACKIEHCLSDESLQKLKIFVDNHKI